MIEIMQGTLNRHLSAAQKFISTRSTLPILSHVLISADTGGTLTISATNLEMAYIAQVACRVHEPFAIALPAKMLASLVGSLPNEMVHMEFKQRTASVAVECASHSATLKGLNAEDFPAMPTFGDAQMSASIDAGEMASVLKSVSFAATKDESRPTLACVNLSFGDNGDVAAVATDGYRLSMISNGQSEGTQLLPAKTAREVLSLCAGADGDVGVFSLGNQLAFVTGAESAECVTIVGQLVEAKYPDYKSIIPDSHTTSVLLDSADLLKACRVSAIFARDEHGILRLSAASGDSDMEIAAASTESGDGKSSVDAKIDGDGIQIALSAQYVIDVLSNVAPGPLTLKFTTPTHPALLKFQNADNYTHVIMPMHPPRR